MERSAVSEAGRETRLWMAQRASAVVLAVCVVVHLGVIIWAVRGGLSAAELLGRTRGSVPVALFYGAFVAAAAIHAPIGLRAALAEWVRWRGRSADATMLLLSLAFMALGARAIWAVVR